MCVDWIPSACVWTGSPLHVCGLDPLHMCVDWIALCMCVDWIALCLCVDWIALRMCVDWISLCMCVDWIPSACVRSATNDLTNQ